MKKSEFGKMHNLKTEQDWMNYFRNNLLYDKLPVAMYSCIYCDDIVDINTTHNCIK